MFPGPKVVDVVLLLKGAGLTLRDLHALKAYKGNRKVDYSLKPFVVIGYENSLNKLATFAFGAIRSRLSTPDGS